MDELVYNTLVQYFKLLANFGYVNYTNVYKVLFLISMQDLTTGGFRSLITEDDYRQIERALYNTLMANIASKYWPLKLSKVLMKPQTI